MKIALHSVYRTLDRDAPSLIDFLTHCSEKDDVGAHQLVSDYKTADCILITEAWRHCDTFGFQRVRNSPIRQTFPKKTFLYCDADEPVWLMPGLYPSATTNTINVANQVSFCYLNGVFQRQEDDLSIEDAKPDLLFSFAGNVKNHSCRQRLLHLRHDRAVLVDSALLPGNTGVNPTDNLAQFFREMLRRSKFVLCPRGKGTSSFRLFETMAAGRVPVIISDAWAEPPGLDWARFSIRIPEKNVAQIPDILASMEAQYEEMAAESREQYAHFYHTRALFNHIGDTLQYLLNKPGNANSLTPDLCLRRSRSFVAESNNECKRLLKGIINYKKHRSI